MTNFLTSSFNIIKGAKSIISISAFSLLLNVNMVWGTDVEEMDPSAVVAPPASGFSRGFTGFSEDFADSIGVAPVASSDVAVEEQEQEQEQEIQRPAIFLKGLSASAGEDLIGKILPTPRRAWYMKFLCCGAVEDTDRDNNVDYKDLLNTISGKLDKNGDGETSLGEIFNGALYLVNQAAEGLKNIHGFLGNAQQTFVDLGLVDRIPALDSLFKQMDEIMGHAGTVINISKATTSEVKTILKRVKTQIDDLKNGDMSPVEMVDIYDDLISYLVILKKYYNSDDISKVITDIVKKLAEQRPVVFG